MNILHLIINGLAVLGGVSTLAINTHFMVIYGAMMLQIDIGFHTPELSDFWTVEYTFFYALCLGCAVLVIKKGFYSLRLKNNESN